MVDYVGLLLSTSGDGLEEHAATGLHKFAAVSLVLWGFICLVNKRTHASFIVEHLDCP